MYHILFVHQKENFPTGMKNAKRCIELTAIEFDCPSWFTELLKKIIVVYSQLLRKKYSIVGH